MVNIGASFPQKLTHICCIGAGYDIHFTVVDHDAQRILSWNSPHLPVYEPGLDDIVKRQRTKNLTFTTDIDQAIRQADMILIAVNTPAMQSTGFGRAPDLRSLEKCMRRIAQVAETDKIIVMRSTEGILRGNGRAQFAVLSNPEFLSEGTAVRDLLSPDRVIIDAQRTLYLQWVPEQRILAMDVWSAELAKLAANAMLAQRVSSVNALSAICERAGAHVQNIITAVGSDRRLGSEFLQASVGFGGPCLQKDVMSLIWLSESLDLPEVAAYWAQVLEMNAFQTRRFAQTIVQFAKGCRVACLGFAYKSGTGDARNAPAAEVCQLLLSAGCRLAIFDPKVPEQHVCERLEERGCEMAHVTVCQSELEAVSGAQAVVVLTAWPQFASLDWAAVYDGMEKPAYVFDGQLVLQPEAMRSLGFRVYQIGHPGAP
ncbi:nucleotide sugar dehydrogenase [Linderina pennispora]|uniref:UDP-glucose 6-dehydrogenase n=1 Tax=Linderina pennispora TaxID=61395 RepID=A0A1Y1WG15_9FUNG|nr:nucleotide sugar dehydrogenase [Linderina pennispora]ORX72422.1 nucleotide sugar dehydrogenase [Linderina pennispora]